MAFSPTPCPVGLSWDSPPSPESVRVDGRRDGDVTTKISRIDRLPNFFTHRAPLFPRAGGQGAPYSGLYGETLPERGAFYKLAVY